jgi:hypothetical protein
MGAHSNYIYQTNPEPLHAKPMPFQPFQPFQISSFQFYSASRQPIQFNPIQMDLLGSTGESFPIPLNSISEHAPDIAFVLPS